MKTAKQTRIQVTIEHETRKALLITDGARKGWIQRRWLKEDGTVSTKTFEKAAATFEAKEESKQAARDFRNSYHTVAFSRETEKAIACEIELETPGGGHERVLAWIPKSQCRDISEGRAKVQGWLLEAKNTDAAENYQPRGYYERHRYCKGERVMVSRGIEILKD